MPTPDHSFELAQDMIKPSNWHMSVDRQTSLMNPNSQETVDSESPEVESSTASEDKDSISKTLSHIDIDRSSSTSFETCRDSVDSFQSISSLPACSVPDSEVFLPSSVSVAFPTSSTGRSLSSFAADLVQTAIIPPGEGSLSSENSWVSQDWSLEKESKSLRKENEEETVSSNVLVENLNQASLSRENKQENASKRMSMEIPPKKAKCIEGSEQNERDEPLPSAPNGQSCNNSVDDLRNAV